MTVQAQRGNGHSQRPGVKTQSESRQPHPSHQPQFWGAYRRPRKEKVLLSFHFVTQPTTFFFFSHSFFFPESLPRCSPISPFPFPVEPHPITLLVSEELRITVIHSRHTLSQISRLITCPFQLIIPNRTPVHRAIITVSPRNFIIKHTRPLLLSWRVSINNQIPESTRRTTCLFHRQSHRWLPCPTFFSFFNCPPTRSHIISSPRATNQQQHPPHPASFRSLIPIRLLPHTPRVSSCGISRSSAQ